jgi:hypothetical protein
MIVAVDLELFELAHVDEDVLLVLLEDHRPVPQVKGFPAELNALFLYLQSGPQHIEGLQFLLLLLGFVHAN